MPTETKDYILIIEDIIFSIIGNHPNDMDIDKSVEFQCLVELTQLNNIMFNYRYFFIIYFPDAAILRAVLHQLNEKVQTISANFPEQLTSNFVKLNIQACHGRFLCICFI